MNKVINYLKESVGEIKKVNWPSKKQTARLTGFVLILSLVIALYVSALDYGLTEVMEALLNMNAPEQTQEQIQVQEAIEDLNLEELDLETELEN